MNIDKTVTPVLYDRFRRKKVLWDTKYIEMRSKRNNNNDLLGMDRLKTSEWKRRTGLLKHIWTNKHS